MRRVGPMRPQSHHGGSDQACASPLRTSIGIKRDGYQKRTPPLSRRGSRFTKRYDRQKVLRSPYPRSGSAAGGGGGGGGGGAGQVASTAITDPSGHVCDGGGGGGAGG